VLPQVKRTSITKSAFGYVYRRRVLGGTGCCPSESLRSAGCFPSSPVECGRHRPCRTSSWRVVSLSLWGFRTGSVAARCCNTASVKVFVLCARALRLGVRLRLPVERAFQDGTQALVRAGIHLQRPAAGASRRGLVYVLPRRRIPRQGAGQRPPRCKPGFVAAGGTAIALSANRSVYRSTTPRGSEHQGKPVDEETTSP
jgi:hypothetical protein